VLKYKVTGSKQKKCKQSDQYYVVRLVDILVTKRPNISELKLMKMKQTTRLLQVYQIISESLQPRANIRVVKDDKHNMLADFYVILKKKSYQIYTELIMLDGRIRLQQSHWWSGSVTSKFGWL